MHMFDKQLTALSAIVRNEDLQRYTGDAFLDLIKAVTFKDNEAGIKTVDDVRKLLFHIPTVLFWDKMKRYLYGTFKEYEDQVRLAAKFNSDNPNFTRFVKRQIHLINELDDDEKVDYFAQLTRSFLLTELEESLFFKLVKFLNICTPYELLFMKQIPYDYASENTAVISSLYQYGLFDQKTGDAGVVRYVLSDYAKSLKQNCLNFDDGIGSAQRLTSYAQIAPLDIAEPLSDSDIDKVFQDTTFMLNSGSATENID